MSCAELAAAFDAHGVWFERVQDYDALRADPQVVYSECFREVPVGGDGRTATLVNHPLRYDGALPEYRRMPFTAGEHSREILAELGYGREEIEASSPVRSSSPPRKTRESVRPQSRRRG